MCCERSKDVAAVAGGVAGSSTDAHLIYVVRSPYTICGAAVTANLHLVGTSNCAAVAFSLDGNVWKEVASTNRLMSKATRQADLQPEDRKELAMAWLNNLSLSIKDLLPDEELSRPGVPRFKLYLDRGGKLGNLFLLCPLPRAFRRQSPSRVLSRRRRAMLSDALVGWIVQRVLGLPTVIPPIKWRS